MHTSNKEIKDQVEHGFVKLQAWLDKKFQQQEDLIRCLSQGRSHELKPPTSRRPSGAGQATKRKTSNSNQSGLPDRPSTADEDPLRMAARIIGPTRSHNADRNSPSKEPVGEDPVLAIGTRANGAVGDFPLPGLVLEDCNAFPMQVPVASIKTDEIAKVKLQASLTSTSDSQMVASTHSSVPGTGDPEWQSKFMDIFDQLDLDGSGSIDRGEFQQVFAEVGMPSIEAFAVFSKCDDGDGTMDRGEWLRIIENAEASSSSEEMDLLMEFIDRLTSRVRKNGRIYANDRTVKPFMIIRHDRPFRMTWDVVMMFLLFYISLSLPYSLGFGQPEALENIDRAFDLLFCIDVVLNFRTSYIDKNDSLILDGKKIGCRYLKSWFLLDFFSSVPFDLLTAGMMPSFQPAKLLKMGKIAKVMKLLKLTSMLKGCEGSELFVQIEEKSASKASQTMVRLVQLMFLNLVLAHWLACFGATVDNAHLEVYFASNNEDPSKFQLYLAAVYWAMTTLSTVGYGDILPTTDFERLYAMFAMVVGGAFYGYIIGTVTSIVSDMDLNARAFSNRMDLVQSWLDCHKDVPKSLRRRVRKSYKLVLSQQSALEDSAILAELSPELRSDMAFFIIHNHVKSNALFYSVSHAAMANLVTVLQNNFAHMNEAVVKVGNPGIAMYCLVDGSARYDKGTLWRPPDVEIEGKKFQKLHLGDSFGEEIIFGLEEAYNYTIVAITACQFHSISEDGFKDQFKSMPQVHEQMYQNFIQARSMPPRIKEGTASTPTHEEAHEEAITDFHN